MVFAPLLFNSSLDFSLLFSSMSLNVTGSDGLTILITLALLILFGLIFRMPEILLIVALLPILTVFSVVDPSYWPILGIVIIVAGGTLFALFKR